MSSIVSGMNAEKTNRWLLIGALVMAVLAGVLVFAALANFSDDDGDSVTQSSGGPETVLVAKQNIPALTTLTEDMFERREVAASDVIANPVSESSAAIGQVTKFEVLKNQQLSFNYLAANDADNASKSLTIRPGFRAVSVGVDDVSGVAGLPVPGDRVDVIVTFEESRPGVGATGTDNEITRVETVLQNVELVEFAERTLDVIPAQPIGTPAAGAPADAPPADASVGRYGTQPDDLDPETNPGTATLQLTPQDVQVLIAAQARGEITLVLRRPGDNEILPLEETNLDDFGYLGPIPRP